MAGPTHVGTGPQLCEVGWPVFLHHQQVVSILRARGDGEGADRVDGGLMEGSIGPRRGWE